MAEAGDNSGPRLREFVDQVIALQDEKDLISTQIANVYKTAKTEGWDTAGIKTVVRRARKDPTEGDAEAWFRDNYWRLYKGLPLLDMADMPEPEPDPKDETTQALREHVGETKPTPPEPDKDLPEDTFDIPEHLRRDEKATPGPATHAAASDGASPRKDEGAGAAPKPKQGKAKPSPAKVEAPDF